MTTTSALAGLSSGELVAFPPGRGNVLLPMAPPRASAAGVALYTAHSRRVLLAQWVFWALARCGAANALPGERRCWEPELDATLLAAFWDEWSTLLGRPVDAAAVYGRPQRTRAGCVLTLVAGDRRLLVRLTRDHDSAARELAVSQAAVRIRPGTFRVPAPLGTGVLDEWTWTAYQSVAGRPHRVFRGDATSLLSDVSELVEAALPRPDVPAHWRGCHGDFAPWNTMRVGRRTWVIDWEDARWAPPMADALYLVCAREATGKRPAAMVPLAREHPEAAAFWRVDLRSRIRRDGGSEFVQRLLTCLGEARS